MRELEKSLRKKDDRMQSDVKLGVYEHYKGKRYQVIGTGHHTETLEKLVFYKALYDTPDFGKQPMWVRPIAMFAGDVEIDNKKLPRFKYISAE